MGYTAKDFNSLIGMQGFSDTLIKNHFTLYQGYVTNTNKLTDALTAMLKDGKTGAPERSRSGQCIHGRESRPTRLSISLRPGRRLTQRGGRTGCLDGVRLH